jgi:hypothetical protein
LARKIWRERLGGKIRREKFGGKNLAGKFGRKKIKNLKSYFFKGRGKKIWWS